MSGPVMKRASGDGVELQLAVWEGNGGPIICIHGITANCRCWDTIAGTLTPDYMLIAPDLRGRGLSDKPGSGYSVDYHCRDIKAMMADQGLSRAVILGHSLGAFIAVKFAADYPELVDRLILVDGAGILTEEQTAKVYAGIKPALDRLGRVFTSIEDYLELMKQTPTNKPWTEVLDTYYRYEVEEVEGGIRTRISPNHIVEETMNNREIDFSQFYPRVQCPTLILRAPVGMIEKDEILLPVNAVKDLVGNIPDAWLVTLKDTHHYSILMQPNKARDQVIKSFLDA